MKNGWKLKKLSEVCEKITDGTHQTPTYFEEGFLFLSSRNVTSGTIDWENVKYIDSKQHVDMQRRVSPRLNDILLAKNGTTGVAAMVDRDVPFDIYVSLALLRPLEAVLPAFLLYFINSPLAKKQFTKRLKGIGVPNLHLEEIREVEIPYPESKAEQRRLIGILDEAFEGIATAKSNAEKNLRNARALFESHLQSVFTQPSDGWSETSLGEAYDVRDGTHDSPKYHATGYPLITSKNLKREGLSFDDIQLISEQDYNKINERSAVHKGDVLFAMIGTIGNPTLVTVEPNFAIKNVALFKIPNGQSGAFLKHYLDSGCVISKMMKEAKGTTQKFVGLGYLRAFPINVPSLSTQLEVVEELDELSQETQRLESIYQHKIAALEALKKSLLHQAFAGKL